MFKQKHGATYIHERQPTDLSQEIGDDKRISMRVNMLNASAQFPVPDRLPKSEGKEQSKFTPEQKKQLKKTFSRTLSSQLLPKVNEAVAEPDPELDLSAYTDSQVEQIEQMFSKTLEDHFAQQRRDSSDQAQPFTDDQMRKLEQAFAKTLQICLDKPHNKDFFDDSSLNTLARHIPLTENEAHTFLISLNIKSGTYDDFMKACKGTSSTKTKTNFDILKAWMKNAPLPFPDRKTELVTALQKAGHGRPAKVVELVFKEGRKLNDDDFK